MISEIERNKVLVSWNEHAESLPERETIKDLLEEQVERTPEATAVVFEDQHLSYDELNRRANRIAGWLGAHGVGPGTLVGVLMEKSIDLVPAVLGVVKAGGAYIPIDPLYPEDRIEFMIADADPAVVLTHAEHTARVPGTVPTVLAIDSPGALDGASEENPPTRASGEDLAYVIYTSGSTGQPKGAMIANRSLVSAYFAYERAYRLRELKAHAQMASFSFDVFTGDLIRSLLAGAKLVLCPFTVVVDPSRLLELMAREGIDMGEFVPATASLLFEYLEREGKRLDFMRLVVVSSEAWRNDRYEFFKSLCGPKTRLVNSYGLTEATIDSTWFEPGPDAQLVSGRFVPIGAPLDNTRVYVLDANLEPQPVGVAGELCVGGVAVARGYLNRSELTAQRFVPDPFSSDPRARLYRSGDLARWLPDGTIEFIGRTDRQIKIRGFRVEPGEIESVLESHPRVQAAAVTDRDDGTGNRHLVAYLVAGVAAEPPAIDTLRALVAEHLPAYMIPAAWVVVDSLPVTPNGKVDLDALPDPEFDRSAAADEYVAPRSAVERQLAQVFSDVLCVGEVGVHDDFFALGGHSLLAVRLFSELERQLGARIPLSVLFQTATVAGLAQMIHTTSEPSPPSEWSSLVTMRRGTGGTPLFLVGWAGGEVLGYRELVDSLDSEVPVYGLRAPGVDRDRLPLATIEEMADHYVDEIRRVQQHGPYMIGGYCFAGLIAYETASRLVAQGEEVALLVLIDAYFNGSSRRPSRLAVEGAKFRAFFAADLRGKAGFVHRRAITIREKARDIAYFSTGRLAYDLLSARDQGARVPRGPWRLVLVASSRARRMYVPKPADVRVHFFRAQTEVDSSPTPWESLALGGVELRQVVVPDINHGSMMHAPHVRVLSEALTEALDDTVRAVSRGRRAAPPTGSAQSAAAQPAQFDTALLAEATTISVPCTVLMSTALTTSPLAVRFCSLITIDPSGPSGIVVFGGAARL
ncbi:MAG: amino acid adenylation domain-containing protein [Actinobacteria bacterium]|nr:amino acid adenylation domain-containing protein [Actinomycetota bacterium]